MNTPSRALTLCLLAACLALGLLPAAAEEGCLLKASAPGAYAVRFWPDRIVLTYTAQTPVAVSVQLAAAARWAVLDGKPLPVAKLKWDSVGKTATADLPAGDHTVNVGWAGSYQQAAEGQKIPVLLDGKPAGSLTCHFDLEKMSAEGSAACPTGTVRVRLTGVKSDLQPQLTVGATTIQEWSKGKETLHAGRPLAVQGDSGLTLLVRGYNLLKSPVAAVELQTDQVALDPLRQESMPEPGLLIEAEDYVSEALGKAEISDKHFETHGGKSIFNNAGDGHYLEYKFTVPQAGAYDLYVRAATQEPSDLRSLAVDGKSPQGLGLVRFPGTGGWGYSKSEWAALKLTGLPKVPSLNLTAGEHTLRVTGEASTHLNLDYFVLVPR